MFTDGRDFDELGWRGLWAYITTAPPGTAIHHRRSEGWGLGDKLAAETLHAIRALLWRYTAVHFSGGVDVEFPQSIDYPGAHKPQSGPSWETVTIDEMVPPEVRKLLQGN